MSTLANPKFHCVNGAKGIQYPPPRKLQCQATSLSLLQTPTTMLPPHATTDELHDDDAHGDDDDDDRRGLARLQRALLRLLRLVQGVCSTGGRGGLINPAGRGE